MIYTLNLVGVLTLLITVGLPLLVALVTKWSTSSPVKGVVLLALDAVATLLTMWYNDAQGGMRFEWKVAVFNAVIAYVISVTSYFGIWRKSALRVGLQSIGSDPATAPPTVVP